jgi:hypothetical protein
MGCEMSKIPHFLDSRITDGGEVVSLTRRPRFIPNKNFLELISVRGWVRLEGLGKLNTFNDLIGNRTRHLPACSTVSQVTTLPRAFSLAVFWTKKRLNIHLFWINPFYTRFRRSVIHVCVTWGNVHNRCTVRRQVGHNLLCDPRGKLFIWSRLSPLILFSLYTNRTSDKNIRQAITEGSEAITVISAVLNYYTFRKYHLQLWIEFRVWKHNGR